MKFSNWIVTAFIGTGGNTRKIHTEIATSSNCQTSLSLFAPQGFYHGSMTAEANPTPSTEQTITTVHVNSRITDALTKDSDSPLFSGIREWLVPKASAAEVAAPPTQEEIKLLREAFATFYGLDRDLEKSEQLLTNVIDAWQRQPPGI